MSTIEVGRQSTVDVGSALLSAIASCNSLAESGREMDKKLKVLDEEIAKVERAIEMYTTVGNHMVARCKNIEEYIEEKKRANLDSLKLAVEQAALVVPDASVKGLQLRVADKKAAILTANGQDINTREGSAYRAVMGMLIRYTLIKNQPTALQAIFLDEAFATLSDISSSNMRECLEAFAKDCLIVGIEQHGVLFEGMERTQFEFIKGEDGVTTVRRTEV